MSTPPSPLLSPPQLTALATIGEERSAPQTVVVNALVTEALRYVAVERGARRSLLNEDGPLSDIFAAGDVRSASTKRCATAVGEGAMAVGFVHAHLSRTPAVEEVT